MPKRKKPSGSVRKRSFAEFITRSFACRDFWAAEVESDESGIRERGYAVFKRWLLDAFERPEPPAPVVDFIKLLVAPNDPTGYSKETLKVFLDHRQNDRDYRAVVSADVGNEGEDFRVRRFLEALIDEKQNKHSYSKATSSLSALICPFFCTRSGISTLKVKEGVHSTRPCSRFEQMLFLAAVARLSFVIFSRKSGKRRKVRDETANDAGMLPALKKLNGSMTQRLGYGIQVLVTGWDSIARELGFKSVEVMVLPYSRIKSSPVMYEVVSHRDEGFVPSSQQLWFQLNVSLTSRRDETFPDAFDRAHGLDKNIRMIVAEFFKDFYAVIQADALYKDEKWSHLEDYAVTGGNLPTRFERLDQEIVRSIATGMTVALRESAMKAAEATSSGHENSEEAESDGHSSPVPDAVVDDDIEKDLTTHMSVLRNAMKEKWKMLPCSFEDLLEAHDQLYPREDLRETVQLILTDPPYNIRRENGSKNASYDTLTVKQMNAVVDVIRDLLRPGGHGILFCTNQQFPLWEQKFNKNGSSCFVVDKVPLVFAWHPALYRSFAGRRSCGLQNSVEFAVHVKKKGLTREQEEGMVNYQNFNHVGSNYPGHKNVISNIRGLRPGEQVRAVFEGSTRPSALRNEQKPLAVIMELICRFSQPGDPVLDMFGGTFSTCVGSFSLERHRQFIGCEADKFCFDKAKEHCLRMFAQVIAEGKTDITVSDEVKEAAVQIFRATRDKRRKGDAKWRAPNGLPQYQALPEKLLMFLASKFEDTRSYFNNTGRGVHEWPHNLQGLLQEVEPTVLRSIDAIACDVIIAKSKIACKHAGLGVFATKTFATGDIIGPFYGMLVYDNLLNRKEVHKTYGEGILGATVARFRSYSIQVPVKGRNFDVVTDLMDGRKAVSIVPAPFCAMGFINDYRYHPDDEECDSRPRDDVRSANAEFVSDCYPIKKPQQLVNPFTQIVRAKTYINPGEEIYIDYGNTFEVFVRNCSTLVN